MAERVFQHPAKGGETGKMNRMYGEFAHLWTLISAPEEYAEEARYWREGLLLVGVLSG